MEKIFVTRRESFWCAYLPTPRSQKYAFDQLQADFKVGIVSVTSDEAPVAFRLSDFSHVQDLQTEIRWYAGKCWQMYTEWDRSREKAVRVGDFGVDSMPRLMHVTTPYGVECTRQVVQAKLKKAASYWLIIDGKVWEQCGEPRYVVNTFGLGHNHGGTSLFVEHYYNSNIPNKNYFSALDGKLAVRYANYVANRRGDTKDVGKFEEMIEVLIPEAVTKRPMQEHGEGDKFINKINAITEAAPDATTAGLLVMMAAFK